MLRVLMTIAVMAAGAMPAAATSIVNYDNNRLINILAETMIVAGKCGPDVQVNHDMRDLVADVVQLKTGSDLKDGPEAAKFYAAVDRFEKEADSSQSVFCLAALGKYGESGKMVRGLVVKN